MLTIIVVLLVALLIGAGAIMIYRNNKAKADSIIEAGKNVVDKLKGDK